MNKRDDIVELYRPSKILAKVCTGLFCANVAISLFAVYLQSNVVYYLTVGLIVIALLYMVISIVDDCIFWFRAESARRKNSIQVAFEVRLDKYETQGYYNNNVADPELSYATNTFESIYFTKAISEKMLFGAAIKLLLSIAILIVSCRLLTNNDILLIVAQTAFSAIVIEDSIRMIIYVQRINKLFDEAYHEFVTIGISKKEQIVWLRWFCTEYESIKAHYRIRLSESVYKKHNPELSKEWDKLLQQIRISKEVPN